MHRLLLAAIASTLVLGLSACGDGGTVSGTGGVHHTSGGGSTGGSSGSSSGSTGGGTTGSATSTTGGTGSTGSSGTSGTTSSDLCSTQRCVVYAETAHDLYQIDPVSLQQTHLCTFNGIIDAVNDIAVRRDGTVFALTGTTLYTVDVQRGCASASVATVAQGNQNFNGLTFTLDGTLLAADQNGSVSTIDPSRGTVTPKGSFGGNWGSSGDMVALSNGVIYATARDLSSGGANTDFLVTLDPTNYSATVVGDVGYHGVFGLGYWANVLYGFDKAGETLKIDPATGAATVLTTNGGSVWYGAGTTPLAPVQPR